MSRLQLPRKRTAKVPSAKKVAAVLGRLERMGFTREALFALALTYGERRGR